MKALVIAPQPFFTPRGTPFSVYYRTLVTTELGVKVDLLTYGSGEDVDLPNVRIIRIPRFRMFGLPKIGPSPLKAFLDVFMVLWTIALLLRNRYSYVHAHEEAIFWCRWLKPIFRFKLAYDMHSSLPQQLRNFNFTKSRLLIGLFERLEKSALRHSDAVITICPDLRDYVLREGVDPERHFLIENSIFEDVRLTEAPPRHQGDGQTKEARAASGAPVGPRVVYAGTFESYQGVDILLRAFVHVKDKAPAAHLLMVGGTPDQVQRMRELADECGLNGHCTFTGRVPKNEARTYLESADVLVSPRREGTNTPLKVYEQLASGKPLVATNIWSHTQVLNEQVCFLVDPTPESMAEGLLTALTRTDDAQRVAAAARELYDTAYARPIYERKMRRFFDVLR